MSTLHWFHVWQDLDDPWNADTARLPEYTVVASSLIEAAKLFADQFEAPVKALIVFDVATSEYTEITVEKHWKVTKMASTTLVELRAP